MNIHSSFDMKQQGFSLVELLIYIAAFAGISIALTTIFFSVAQNQILAESRFEVHQNMRSVTDTIRYAVAQAVDVTDTGDRLELVMEDGTISPTVFSLSDGIVYMTEAGGSPLQMTSDKVEIQSMHFRKVVNPVSQSTEGTVSIQFEIATRYRSNGNPQLEYGTHVFSSAPLHRTAEIAPYTCEAGHTDNGNGSCTVEFNITEQTSPQGFYQAEAPGSGTVCPSATTIATSSESSATTSRTDSEDGCKRTAAEFDIASLAVNDGRVVVHAAVSFTTASTTGSRTCQVRSIETAPSSLSGGVGPDAQVLWDDIGDGSVYAENIACANASGGPIGLAVSAIQDLQSAVDTQRSWFALGWKLEDESRPSNDPAIRGSQFNNVILSVTYRF